MMRCGLLVREATPTTVVGTQCKGEGQQVGLHDSMSAEPRRAKAAAVHTVLTDAKS